MSSKISFSACLTLFIAVEIVISAVSFLGLIPLSIIDVIAHMPAAFRTISDGLIEAIVVIIVLATYKTSKIIMKGA